MHAALRKWVLVALSSFNLLVSVALLSTSSPCSAREPMSQLGIDARDVLYVLKYVVGTSAHFIHLTRALASLPDAVLVKILGTKNLWLAFARLVGSSSSANR